MFVLGEGADLMDACKGASKVDLGVYVCLWGVGVPSARGSWIH